MVRLYFLQSVTLVYAVTGIADRPQPEQGSSIFFAGRSSPENAAFLWRCKIVLVTHDCCGMFLCPEWDWLSYSSPVVEVRIWEMIRSGYGILGVGLGACQAQQLVLCT
jgi:hypothetical protein